jgi:uncharacterized protein YndB with AHSA1/START domain
MSAEPGGAEPVAAREIVITRVFDLPARILFQAYSECRHIRRWFGPRGWPVTMCEMDFRVGGTFRFAMTGPSGERNTPFGGTYREIVPNRRIVYDNGFETPGAGRMIVTVTFVEARGRTAVTITTLFDTIAMRNEHVGMGYTQGTNSAMDNLLELSAELLALEAK